MASVVIGDYEYNTNGSVKVVDTTKESYGSILSSFEYQGKTYNVTNMSECFRNCTSLIQAPEIPSSVMNMNSCFRNCISLTQAPSKIPSSVTNMERCFSACLPLVQAPTFEMPSSVTNMSQCFRDCQSLTQAPEIPSSVTDMSHCFRDCFLLRQAPEIPSSVEAMNYCFNGCTSLTQAPEIPSSVTNMSSCFFNCTSLTNFIVIHAKPSNVVNIFEDMSNSIQIYTIDENEVGVYNYWKNQAGLPSNITVAEDIPNYKKFTIGDYEYSTNSNYNLDVRAKDETKTEYGPIKESIIIGNGWEYKTVSMFYCFEGCTSLTQAPEIPPSVTNMNSCFKNCASLVQAPEIPSSVTNMYSCFRKCTSLIQAPEIPPSVETIGGCFYGCTSLVQAPPEIPSGITSMRDCFCNCTSLTQTPEMPSSVTNMESCFEGCTSLTQALEIPSSVTNMYRCFEGCTSLTQTPTFETPSSVTNMERCFCDCTSLVQAPEIPSGVIYMGYCFYNCISLTQAPPEIPLGVTSMDYCFQNCTSLTQVPEIPSSVRGMRGCFRGCTILSGNIVVYNSPAGLNINNMFTGTLNDIFIINEGSGETSWKNIASQYSNVHYEADDHIPPQAILKLTRTDSSGTTSQTGTYVKIEIEYQIYPDYIPIGWAAPTLTSERLAYDSDIEFTPVQTGRTRGPYELDGERHTITYTINDGYKTTVVTATLSRVMALLDFFGNPPNKEYPNDIPGMGMAIGNIATRNGLDIQFPTTIGEGLIPTIKNGCVDLDNYQLIIGKYNDPNEDLIFAAGNGTDEDNRSNAFGVDWGGNIIIALDTNAASGEDFDIYDALTKLEWDDDCIV